VKTISVTVFVLNIIGNGRHYAIRSQQNVPEISDPNNEKIYINRHVGKRYGEVGPTYANLIIGI
jgi:hypothetical protein